MNCKGCASTEFGAKLGNCAFCVGTAAISALLFWGLYVVSRHWQAVHVLQWPTLLFAVLVTLLLVAHLLAYVGRTHGRDGDRPADERDRDLVKAFKSSTSDTGRSE
jgi:hypothetical protein